MTCLPDRPTVVHFKELWRGRVTSLLISNVDGFFFTVLPKIFLKIQRSLEICSGQERGKLLFGLIFQGKLCCYTGG